MNTCCDHQHHCGADERHFHSCCGHWHGVVTDIRPTLRELTARRLHKIAAGVVGNHETLRKPELVERLNDCPYREHIMKRIADPTYPPPMRGRY